MSSRKKGQRREKQVRDVYKRAGFAVESPNYTRYGNSDFYNLFDLMAVKPGCKPRFVQVKSNKAEGITWWMDSVRAWFPREHLSFDFVVVFDGEGMRLSKPREGTEPSDYAHVVDEREADGNMGDGLLAYLSRV